MTDSQIDKWYADKQDEWDKRTRQLRMYKLGFVATLVLLYLFMAFLGWKGLLP